MASSTLQSAGIGRYTIWAARLVVFAAFFDLFVQFPTIAPFVSESLGASAALVGLIVAAYSFTNLFGNLGAGYVLDRWGRRTPMLLGMAITVIAVFSYSLVQTPEQMMAARAVHGIGAAVLAPGAFSIIGDRTAADRWGRAMGITGALIAVAALIGPPAAGILREKWGADTVFYVDSAFIVITLIAFLIIARDDTRTAHTGDLDGLASPQDTSKKPALWSAYAAAFTITVGIGALVTYLPLMLEEQGETAARSGYSFGIYALVAMLVMASPISRAGDRYGRFGPLMLGLVGIAIGLALLGVLEGYGGVVGAWRYSDWGTDWSFPPQRPSWRALPARTGVEWPSGSSTPSTRSEWSSARRAVEDSPPSATTSWASRSSLPPPSSWQPFLSSRS